MKERLFAKKNEVTDLQEFILKKNPDVIFINTIVPLPLLIPKVGQKKIRAICYVREMQMGIKKYLGTDSERYLGAIHHFFTVNSSIKQFLHISNKVALEKIQISPGPFVLSLYNETKNVSRANKFRIAMAGTPIFRKGIDIAIHLASLLKEENITFHWFGKIDTERRIELNYEIENRGLTDIFYLEGEVENLYQHLATMDAFFMSSREDPFPRVAIEAAMAELPIILFKNCTGLEDVFTNEINCIVVSYLDYYSLKSNILNLKNGKGSDIGKNARQAALQYLIKNDATEVVIDYLTQFDV